MSRPIVCGKVSRISYDLVQQFSKLDVATVYEAAREGLLAETVAPMLPGIRACGPAVTAFNSPGDNLAMHVALELAEAGDVLVVAAGSEEPSATWGGMVTESAVAKQIAGLVTDGHIRDLSTCRAKGFPVWARGVTPRGATKADIQGVNVPINCGGVRISPGDLILADDDGVIVVSQGSAREVLAGALARGDREKASLVALASGTTPFRLHEMADALKAANVDLVDCDF